MKKIIIFSLILISSIFIGAQEVTYDTVLISVGNKTKLIAQPKMKDVLISEYTSPSEINLNKNELKLLEEKLAIKRTGLSDPVPTTVFPMIKSMVYQTSEEIRLNKEKKEITASPTKLTNGKESRESPVYSIIVPLLAIIITSIVNAFYVNRWKLILFYLSLIISYSFSISYFFDSFGDQAVLLTLAITMCVTAIAMNSVAGLVLGMIFGLVTGMYFYICATTLTMYNQPKTFLWQYILLIAIMCLVSYVIRECIANILKKRKLIRTVRK
ncbi:MAG: hypothetical protein ACOYMB_05105 [Patescibacteria group bacterium]